jgi:hypothetical protein
MFGNRKLSPWVFLSVLLLAVLLIAGCESNEDDDDGPPTFPSGGGNTGLDPIIDEDSEVLPETGTSLTRAVGNTYVYEFTGTVPTVQTGDVLVDPTGTGRLLRVTSTELSGSQLTVTGEQARITDAVVQGSLEVTEPITVGTQGKTASAVDDRGWHTEYLAEGVRISDQQIDLEDFTIYEGDIDNASVRIQLDDGHFEIDNDFQFNLEISNSQISYAKAGMEGTMGFDLDASASIGASMNRTFERTLATFVSTQVYYIHFFPVVVTYRLSFVAGSEVNLDASGTLSAGFDYSATTSAGVEYDNGQWDPYSEFGEIFNGHDIVWNQNTQAMLKCYVQPRLDVELYSVLGPYVYLDPYLEFDGDVSYPAWEYELSASLDGYAAFEVDVLDNTLVDFSQRIFSFGPLILAQDAGTVSGTSIGVSVPSTATVWHPGDQNVGIQWDGWDLGGTVSIDLYRGTSYVTQIAQTVTNSGYYSFDVPETLTESSQYRVLVSHDSYSLMDYSDYFAVAGTPPGDLTVTVVNQGADVGIGNARVTCAGLTEYTTRTAGHISTGSRQVITP